MATNTLGAYNPIFYAQEALIQLEQSLGFAARVYRGYDTERRSYNLGDTITIRKPGKFTAAAAPSSTAQNVATQNTSITLNQWYDVKFGLTDKELAYTGRRIIDEHIRPAAVALASNVDAALAAKYKASPWSTNMTSTVAATDLLSARKILRDLGGPIVDSGDIHMALDSQVEADLLNLGIFSNAATGSDVLTRESLLFGTLGNRFGIEFFPNSNIQTHTSGTLVSTKTDLSGTLATQVAAGATTVYIAATGTVSETIAVGDSFVITGNTQRYAVTTAATIAAGATATLAVTPPVAAAAALGAVVTFETPSTTNYADKYYANMLFHRNAFALAMAPLPEIGDGAGANMAVVTDPLTGLSVRSRLAYDDTTAQVLVTLDILYGISCLDPNLAVVMRRNY